MNERADAVVIGGGPAGLSAALWLGRHRKRTVLLDSGAYRNLPVIESYGYFASDATNPAELRRLARKDLQRYETVRICEQAVEVVRPISKDGYEVIASQDVVRCRAVVLATGVRDKLPDVEGLAEHYGTSVFHCPHCDGYETRGKAVVVIGCDESAVDIAKQLSEWAAQVTMVVRNAEDDPCPSHAGMAGITVCPHPARRIIAEGDRITAVELADGQVVRAQVIFFSTDPRPSNDLARSLGCQLDEAGCVSVDHAGMTKTRGVFAAGDLVPGPKLIQIAAASGAVAGIGCAEFLASIE